MDFKSNPTSDHFNIAEINKPDGYLVVEDEELGLAYTVRPKKNDWIRAEIFNVYSVKFFYDGDETEVVTFMN